MKLRILVLLAIPLACLVGQEKKVEKKPAKPREVTVPAGAKEIEPFTYRYTDPQGKTWIYRKTPFGVVKIEEKPEEKTVEEAPDDTRVFEEGDSIRFERQTPFGTARWVRKKTELNEAEQAVWERERKRKKQAEKTAGRKKEGR